MRGLKRAGRNLLTMGFLVSGLSIVFVVSGYVVPPYLFIIAVALPIAGMAFLVADRVDRRFWSAYILVFVVFTYLRALADLTPFPIGWEYVISLDSLLFFGEIPTLWMQAQFYRLGSPSVWDYYSVLIHFTYFFLPHLFAFGIWRRDRRLFHRYAAAAIATYYAALLACFILPTAPPWLAGQTERLPHVYRVVEDLLKGYTPAAYDYAYSVAGTNAVAAMPSLHMAIACVIAFASSRIGPAAGALGWGYAASMGLVLVYTGEHYAVDLLAGIALAAICWKAAGAWLCGWLAKRVASISAPPGYGKKP